MKENEIATYMVRVWKVRNTDMKTSGRTETPVEARNWWNIILNWILKHRM
jgi:hypothetical protein